MSTMLLALILGTGATPAPGGQASVEPADRYQWLEDVSGARSMAWVRAQNERTAKVLASDPRYAQIEASALKVLEAPERLPMPEFHQGELYNTWRDARHVRGVLRRASVAQYLTSHPRWQVVLDYDALARADHENWVEKGIDCLYPGNELCMVGLSAGGEDAVTLREFNLKKGSFVEHGFALPRSKQSTAWLDKDSLLVARDWGAGSLTRSGYPFVVKLWKRGQALAQAREVYRGEETDADTVPAALDDSQGDHVMVVIRDLDSSRNQVSLLTPEGTRPIRLPDKSSIAGLLDGQMIVTINEDWKPEGGNAQFAEGSVVSLDLAAMKKGPVRLQARVVFTPTSSEFAQDAEITSNHLILTTLDHVQGRAYVCSWNASSGWTRKKLDLPDNHSVSIAATNNSDDQFFLLLGGFLTPSSLWLGDAARNTLREAKSLLPQFDSSADVVEQLEAVSKDGTKVPYFVVRRKDIKYDGTNPTLLTAYGGFQISETPLYSAVLGKLWLERGGVFVNANIRGGGEFGPAWHEAGVKTKRQSIYDDFAAVGQDLVNRNITSPRRLGIVGGSNGGLLMGVEMTQHPEMWNAVVIQIPLLDMLRFEQIAAGASWIAEYGSVAVPEERVFLASISPYNQLKPDVNYPEPLIFTTTKDDRVGPAHARKFAAKMEEYKKPFFYQEIIEGGHAEGANLKEEAETSATEYIYLIRKLMD